VRVPTESRREAAFFVVEQPLPQRSSRGFVHARGATPSTCIQSTFPDAGSAAMKTATAALASLALLALPGFSGAETLLVERVQEESRLTLPARGMGMPEVERRFGAPSERAEPRGGQKPQWPTIHRWVYPGFTVYFENSRVIDAVANRAGADEIGPKPATR